MIDTHGPMNSVTVGSAKDEYRETRTANLMDNLREKTTPCLHPL